MARDTKHDVYEYIESLYSQKVGGIKLPDSQNENELRMQISPLEGMLLSTLLKTINAKHILEIGTLLGYSTKWLANVVGYDGKVITIEKSTDAFNRAQQALNDYNNVECVNADAVTYLKNTKFSKELDAVFIDADKTNYQNYFDLCLPLVRQGGLIIIDNTLMFGEILKESSEQFREKTLNAVREFNQIVSQSDLVDSIIIPTNSGLTIAIKK
jgi:caffeoyl-CoA O-methyltransferase